MYKKDLLRHDIQTFYTLQTITHYAYIAYYKKEKKHIFTREIGLETNY